MAANSDLFLKKALGDDFFESLSKIELWKPGTESVIDHEEIKTALKIVPRTIMALLISELAPMKVGENKEVRLPVGGNVVMQVNKNERDVYTGEIHENNEFVVGFKLRPLPGVGLIIMSAFELYNVDELTKEHAQVESSASDQVQKLIDDRLALQDLIARVVDGKLAQRDAVHAMMMLKLTEELRSQQTLRPLERSPSPTIRPPVITEMLMEKQEKKRSPLKGFLDKRKDKKKPNQFEIVMAKGETVDCPDCHKNIFDGTLFSGCICLGDDRDKKLYIKKSETGINVRFGRGWDEENIEMLVDVLRKRHGER